MMKKKWAQMSVLLLTLALFSGILAMPAKAVYDGEVRPFHCYRCNNPTVIIRIDQPTCTSSGGVMLVCPKCGAESMWVGTPELNALNLPALGHDFQNGVCTRCQAKDPNYQPPSVQEPCSHVWSPIPLKDACPAGGPSPIICLKCGACRPSVEAAHRQHVMVSEITRQPTVSIEGIRTYSCKYCSYSYSEAIPCLKPSKSEVHTSQTETTPDNTTPGDETGSDSRKPDPQPEVTPGNDGSTPQSDVRPAPSDRDPNADRENTTPETKPSVKPENKPCKYHSWSYEYSKPTCEEEGHYFKICSKCGLQINLSTEKALGHQYESVVTRPATSSQEGIRTFTCKRCGKIRTESIPRLAASAGESPVNRNPNAKALISNNAETNQYRSWSSPMNSYLYQRQDGLYTRVEAPDKGNIQVEIYDKDFQLMTTRTVSRELPVFGGFFAGENYNFLIFGQENLNDSPSVEVFRVVKYSKDWERLGQTSLRGANTYLPFDAGSLRCAESSGILYVHTAHEMFETGDGLHHQANVMLVIRQSDMVLTDHNYGISNTSTGYVSHSFNQFVLVDDQQRVVTLNHGDAIPRGAVLLRYALSAGEEKLINYNVGGVMIHNFGACPGNYNYTGAQLGGLAASSDSYLAAMASVPNNQGDVSNLKNSNIIISVVNQSLDQNTIHDVPLTHYNQGDQLTVSVPQLVKLSNDRFLVLWETGKTAPYGITDQDGSLFYTFIDGHGHQIGSIMNAHARLSDCQPIYDGERVLWYYTRNSSPIFCTIDGASGNFSSVGNESVALSEVPKPEADPKKPGAAVEKPGANSAIPGTKPTNPDAGLVQPGENPGASGATPTAPQSATVCGFQDIRANAWCAEAVRYVKERGLMNGTSTTTFTPNGTVTRGMIVAILHRLDGSPAASGANGFQDVAPTRYFDEATRWAAENGIVTGYADGNFRPDQPISRQQMAVILNRYSSLKEYGGSNASLTDFQDFSAVSDYARNAMSWAVGTGLISGKADGRLDPSGTATRAQVATILMRFSTTCGA